MVPAYRHWLSIIGFGGHSRARVFAYIATCILVIAGYLGGAFEQLELWSYDTRVRLSGQIPAEGSPVALILVDERSIRSFGQWPWPRTLHARLVRVLSEAGAKAIAFDIVFAEPDSKSPLGDRALAQAMEDAGNVVLAIPAEDKRIIRRSMVFETRRTVRPEAVLTESARALGHVVAVPDRDGVVRSLPVAVVAAEGLYFGLAVEATRLYFGGGRHVQFLPGRFLDLGKSADGPGGSGRGSSGWRGKIPLDGTSSALINYRLRRAIKVFSYVDVISGSASPREFAGKAVLIGVAAPGLGDSYATPISVHGEPVSGAEINSFLLATIIQGEPIRRTGPLLTILGIVLTAALPWFLLRRPPGRGSPKSILARALAFAGMAGTALAGTYALFLRGLWLDVVPLAGALVVSYVVDMSLAIRDEIRHRERIRATFERYLAPEAVRDILSEPSLARLGGTRRHLTVMFADIRGFTSFARGRDPAEVCEILNDYLSVMGRAVFEEGGAVDKFTGDGIMAMFGAPVAIEDREQHAVKAALKILGRVRSLPHGLAVGIGMASGEVVVGNIGMPNRMDYTAIGTPVNLASRLEGLAGPQVILIDGPTRASLAGSAAQLPAGVDAQPPAGIAAQPLAGIAIQPFGEVRLSDEGLAVEVFQVVQVPGASEVVDP